MPTKTKSTPGRPRRPSGPREIFSLKLSGPEREQITTAAKRAGMTVTEYLRCWGLRGPKLIYAAGNLADVVEPDAGAVAGLLCAAMRREIQDLPRV